MPSSRLCPILIPLLQAAESILETIYRESVLAPSLECSIKQYNIQVCISTPAYMIWMSCRCMCHSYIPSPT